jgi:hypothetical protein
LFCVSEIRQLAALQMYNGRILRMLLQPFGDKNRTNCVQIFSFYLTKNKFGLYYKDQTVKQFRKQNRLSDYHKKHVDVLRGQNAESVNFPPSGTFS